MKIEHLTDPAQIEAKRFYAPLRFTDTCPECGREVVKDCSGDYLSFPELNKPTKIHFYCSYWDEETDEDIEHEFERWVILRLTAEEVETPDDG